MPKSLDEELDSERLWAEFAAQFPDNISMAMAKARSNKIAVKYKKLSKQWICVVRGEVAHINDLPKLIDMVIAGKLLDA